MLPPPDSIFCSRSRRAFFSAVSARACTRREFICPSWSCDSVVAALDPTRLLSVRKRATASSDSLNCWRSSTRRSDSHADARLAASNRASSLSTT